MAEEAKILLKADASGLAQGTKTAEKEVDKLDRKTRDANGRFIKGSASAGASTKKLAEEVGGAKKATEGLGDSGSNSFRKYSQGADNAAKATRRIGNESKKISNSGAFIEKAAPKALNSITALVAGGGIALAGKQTIDFNKQLTQMGVNARDADGKLNGKDFGTGLASLKSQIMSVAQESGQAPEALLEGMNAIVERTGNLDLATKSLGLMAKASVATGAAMIDVGALVSNLGEKAGVGPEQVNAALEILIQQGKAGAFTMKDLATEGERLFSVFPQFGKMGEGGLRSFGAFVQMAKKGSGSAAEASTSIAALASELSDVALLQDKLKKAGIKGVKFFDSKGEKRAAEDIIKDIVKTAKGSADKISVAFGESARKTVIQMANEYKAGKGFDMFDSFKTANGQGVIDKDSATMLAETSGQMDKLAQQARLFSEGFLVTPLKELTDFMTFVNTHAAGTQTAFKLMAAGAGALAATVALIKMKEFGGWMKESLASNKPGTVGADGKQQKFAMGGVQQVFVTNWPGGGMGGSGAGGSVPYDPANPSTPDSSKPKPTPKPKGKVGRFFDAIKNKVAPSRAGKVLGSVAKFGTKGLPAIKALGRFAASGPGVNMLYNAGGMMLDGGITGENVAGLIGGSLGGLVGGIGGLGAASIPLAMAGGYGGDMAGRALYNKFFAEQPNEAINYHTESFKPFTGAPMIPQAPPTLEAGITINIDRDGRMTTSTVGRDADNFNITPSLGPRWTPAMS